ncbi:MAG: acyl-CoA dehydrogenase family protein [Deltaproteobacteria bacterium]|nr:acyl-CoA dehydrogenase family protein [Deltaproteobacteria bacterium]MBW2665141.1 acyl-CoA dehydrogenase family protein [Deltaproteobacteria bacterium]
MDLTFSEEDEAYRAELRQWLSDNIGGGGGGGGESANAMMKRAESSDESKNDPLAGARAWPRTLHDAGYVGLAWPKAYGGQDASFTQQVICADEMARVRTPPLINTIGLSIIGPTLVQHGTEEQKKRFLPRILRADDLWCQGFSEPEAGSDLASLRCRAEIDGDEFVVNGQKVWTSLAPISDWIFMLVRTDPDAPKREGISYLLADMKTPGITVRPLRNAAGGSHFSEVFFDNVRVPREHLVGELNGGWQIARSSLDHERSGLSGVVALEETLGRLWRMASNLDRGDHKAVEEPSTRRALAQHWIEIEGLRHLGFRTLSNQIAGKPPGAGSSVGKLFASETRNQLTRTALRVEGPLAPIAKRSPHVVDRGRWHAAYFDALAHSIGGGTSEVMRNVIAEKVLELPRPAED